VTVWQAEQRHAGDKTRSRSAELHGPVVCPLAGPDLSVHWVVRGEPDSADRVLLVFRI